MPAERPVSDARIDIAARSTTWKVLGEPGDGRFLIAWVSVDRGGQAVLFDEAGRRIGDTSIGLPLRPYALFWRDGAWTLIGHTGSFMAWVRMDREGRVLDPEPHRLIVPDGSLEAAVWTGESLLIATQKTQPASETVFRIAVFDEELNWKATYDIGRWALNLRLETDGQSALLVFKENWPLDNRPTHARMFGRDGALLEAKELAGIDGVTALGSPEDGSGYFLVTRSRGTDKALFSSYAVDHKLALQSRGGFGRAEALYATSGTVPWDGSAYVFFYYCYRDRTSAEVRMVRISTTGAVIEDAPALLPDLYMRISRTGMLSFAWNGTVLFAYYRTDKASDYAGTDDFLTLRAGHAPADFASAGEVHLERGAFQQIRPAAASSLTQSLLVWRERFRPTEPLQVMATRVDAHGKVLDPQSLFLGNASCVWATPGVASDGDGFLVTWYDPEGVMVAHVRSDGTLGPKTRLQKYKDDPCQQLAPPVVSNGRDYLVVWKRTGQFRDTVFAARFSAGGHPIDTVPIELGTADSGVAVASDGVDYLLAWDGRILRLGANGTLRDTKITMNLGGRVVGGIATAAMWWNGSAYSLLQLWTDRYPYPYQLVHLTPDAASTTVGTAMPWPSFSKSWGYGTPVCRGSGCTWRTGTIEDGEYLLRELQVASDGSAPLFRIGNASAVQPVLLRDSYESMSIVSFGVPGGRQFVAFTRYVLEPPFAGISRIFIRAADAGRTRVTRH